MAAAGTSSSVMSKPQAGPSSVQEFVVRIPKAKQKKFNIMRFRHSQKVDVTKWTQARMERENNLKEFKAEEDQPKFGAGSEFGREQREESRRKKYGIVSKKYNPEDQPWQLKLGGRGGKRFKGVREGGVAENASYYVFTQAADGLFEAYPVEQWYNFTPVQCYKSLNAEEAEEEFGKRDKVLNHFSIMFKKRLQKEHVDDDDGEDGDKQSKKKTKKQQKDFKISDMDDWARDSSDSEKEDEDEGEETKKPIKKKKKEKTKKDKSDDEGQEESDEGDFDDREVDYMTGSSSSGDEREEDKNSRQMKGVEDEDAIRKLDQSEYEEEEEENNKEPEETQEKEKTPEQQKSKVKPKKDGKDSSGESTSDTSDSDFDDNNIQTAVFMQKAAKKNASDNSAGSSRANTPTRLNVEGSKEGLKSSQKRKWAEAAASSSKKPKTDNYSGSSTVVNSLDGINEEALKRYLSRKPMTASELLHKFKSKKSKLNSDQLVTKIADVLKKMDLIKTNIKGKMYLSLKS